MLYWVTRGLIAPFLAMIYFKLLLVGLSVASSAEAILILIAWLGFPALVISILVIRG